MIEIRAIMDSPVEEIFGFKCCGNRGFDQNLEILLTNHGAHPVTVPSYCDLHESSGVYRVRNLMPHGQHLIPPGATLAFYCFMDESRWNGVTRMVFHDIQGNQYESDIVPIRTEEK